MLSRSKQYQSLRRKITLAVATASLVVSLSASAFILPLIAAGIVWLGTPIGISTMASATLVTSALFIEFSHDTTPPATTADSPLIVQLNPKAPLPVPGASANMGAWSAPTFPAIQPVPPATENNTAVANGLPAPSGATVASPCTTSTVPFGTSKMVTGQNVMCVTVCQAADGGLSAPGPTLVSQGWSVTDNAQDTAHCSLSSKFRYVLQSTATNACPDSTGYTINSSGVCNLTTAANVQKPSDNKTAILRSGNTFIVDPQDVTDQIGPSSTNVVLKTNSVDVFDASGNRHTVTINSDGTSSAVTYIPNSSTGTTSKTETDFSAPNASTGEVDVIGKSTSTLQGLGSTAPPITSTSATITNPSSGTTDVSNLATHSDVSSVGAKVDAVKSGQCGGAGEPACKIDEGNTSDQTTSAVNAANSQISTLNSLFDQLEQKAQGQTGGVGTSLPNPISAVIPASTCQNPVFDASDVNANARAELHLCEHVGEAQPLLRWCTYMFTAVGIFGLWFRKLGGT